jgi:hypothetical protein
MRRRRIAALAAVVASGVFVGCRPDTVRLGFEPEVGATYRYVYEIEATITRTVEGEAPRTSELSVTLESTQTVTEVTAEGTRLEVTLQSSSTEAPSTASVVVDRAGSLQAIQQIDGLPASTTGLSTDALLAAAATETPDRPLAVGDRWEVRQGTIRGDGRLDRLGILDGDPAAFVEIDLLEALSATEETGGSQVVLEGDLRTSATTAFDVEDGSVREGHTHSRGDVDVVVAPPAGVDATPVEARVTYELRVTTTRTG